MSVSNQDGELRCPPIILKSSKTSGSRKYALLPNSPLRHSGMVVRISCMRPEMVLVGPVTLRCMNNGQWNDSLPHCADGVERSYSRWSLDASAVAMVGAVSAITGAATVVVVILCLVYYLCVKDKSNKDLNNSLLNSDDLFLSEQSNQAAFVRSPMDFGRLTNSRKPKTSSDFQTYMHYSPRSRHSRGISYVRYNDINYTDNGKLPIACPRYDITNINANELFSSAPYNTPWSDILDVSKLGRLPRYVPDSNGLYRGVWNSSPRNSDSKYTEC